MYFVKADVTRNVNEKLRIGADAMLHLLLKTSIFASLPNECLCQLTGEPLIFVSLPGASSILATHTVPRKEKRKLESSGALLPRKRQKLVSGASYAGSRPIKVSSRNQPLEKYVVSHLLCILITEHEKTHTS